MRDIIKELDNAYEDTFDDDSFFTSSDCAFYKLHKKQQVLRNMLRRGWDARLAHLQAKFDLYDYDSNDYVKGNMGEKCKRVFKALMKAKKLINPYRRTS